MKLMPFVHEEWGEMWRRKQLPRKRNERPEGRNDGAERNIQPSPESMVAEC